jgi:transposase
MSRQVRKYTKEFKQEAVNLALKSPAVTSAARELGIPSPTLNSWIHAFKTPEISQSNKKHSTSAEHDVAALLAENRRLHKELAIAREEKEILKKAAAYFAQHQK